MHPILLDLGFIRLHTYGFCISLGVVAALLLAIKLGRSFDISRDFILDLTIKLLISGIIGSKILYIMVYYQEFIQEPVRIIRDFRSGFVFFGGLILAFIMGYLHVRKSKYRMGNLFDVFTPALALAHSFGRLGCTMAGCCYGKAVPHDAFYTLRFCHPETIACPVCRPLIATQPISSIFLFLLSMLMLSLFFKWKKRYPGSLLFIYASTYSLFRFIIEFFRGDDRGFIFGLSTSQVISMAVFPAAIYLLFKYNIRRKKP